MFGVEKAQQNSLILPKMNKIDLNLELDQIKENCQLGLTRHSREQINSVIDDTDSSRALAGLYVGLIKLEKGFSQKSIVKFLRKLRTKIYVKCVYNARSFSAQYTFLRKVSPQLQN